MKGNSGRGEISDIFKHSDRKARYQENEGAAWGNVGRAPLDSEASTREFSAVRGEGIKDSMQYNTSQNESSLSPITYGSRGAISGGHHHHHHTTSLRMEDLGLLMREQDADLLESIHMKGPNQTGMTPVLKPSHMISQAEEQIVPPLSLEDGVEIAYEEQPSSSLVASIEVSSPKQRNHLLQHTNHSSARYFSRMYSSELAGSSVHSGSFAADHLSPRKESPVPPQNEASVDISIPGPDSCLRTLSGEIFSEQQERIDVDFDAADFEEGQIEDQDNAVRTCSSLLFRTESTERRINEAAQFAEAVGDLPFTEQQELLIDDGGASSEDDTDDEDENATEIHVERRRLIAPQPPKTTSALPTTSTVAQTCSLNGTADNLLGMGHLQQQTQMLSAPPSSPIPTTPETPIKIRPQWHEERLQQLFAVTKASAEGTVASLPPRRHSAGFLTQLPSSMASSTQDFVYKGIRANPPEIVKRGTTRGNYAQLHRKAWLEVSDKYHRYGKHLRLYYRYWERVGCPTNMFFDWLDSKGEAAGEPLPVLDECPRSKLDSDTVLYITNPDLTEGYALQFEVEKGVASENDGNEEVINRGRVLEADGTPVKTGPDGWIFVLRDNVMYGAQKVTSVSGHSKQRFHHSSFFGGKAVAAAGIFITDDEGFLTRLYPHSGHYRPGEAHMQRVLFFLYHKGVDLRSFQMDTQQILHVARDKVNDGVPANDGASGEIKLEKKKKIESLHLMPAVLVACFLAHKARFIGEGIFSQIHQIRKSHVRTVREALEVIDGGGCSRGRRFRVSRSTSKENLQ